MKKKLSRMFTGCAVLLAAVVTSAAALPVRQNVTGEHSAVPLLKQIVKNCGAEEGVSFPANRVPADSAQYLDPHEIRQWESIKTGGGRIVMPEGARWGVIVFSTNTLYGDAACFHFLPWVRHKERRALLKNKDSVTAGNISGYDIGWIRDISYVTQSQDASEHYLAINHRVQIESMNVRHL